MKFHLTLFQGFRLSNADTNEVIHLPVALEGLVSFMVTYQLLNGVTKVRNRDLLFLATGEDDVNLRDMIRRLHIKMGLRNKGLPQEKRPDFIKKAPETCRTLQLDWLETDLATFVKARGAYATLNDLCAALQVWNSGEILSDFSDKPFKRLRAELDKRHVEILFRFIEKSIEENSLLGVETSIAALEKKVESGMADPVRFEALMIRFNSRKSAMSVQYVMPKLNLLSTSLTPGLNPPSESGCSNAMEAVEQDSQSALNWAYPVESLYTHEPMLWYANARGQKTFLPQALLMELGEDTDVKSIQVELLEDDFIATCSIQEGFNLYNADAQAHGSSFSTVR